MTAGQSSNNGAEFAVSAEHLVRKFGDFAAVNDVSFRIRKGEIFGFLGPNGSGKTTVIKMLTGLLPLTAGAAWVEGLDVRTDSEAVRERIGYMSQNFSLYNDLTVSENLTFYGRIYSLPPETLKRRRSPADGSSASRSDAPCCTNPSSFFSTSRLRESIPSPAASFGTSSSSSPPMASRFSSPPTTWTKPNGAITSPTFTSAR